MTEDLMKRMLLALVVLLAAAAPARAQADAEGCKDHALFARMPGFHISGCDSEDPSSFEFDTRGGQVRVEGQYWKVDYWTKDGVPDPAPRQVIQNYWKVVAARGGTRLFEQVDAKEGLLTTRMPGPKGSGPVWLQVHVTMEGEVYSLTIVQEKVTK